MKHLKILVKVPASVFQSAVSHAALGFVLAFVPVSSWALTGIYIDPSEHIPQACVLVGRNMTKETVRLIPDPKHPDDPKRVTRGKPVFEEIPSEMFCSASLIGPNELITSAHCYPKIMDQEYQIEHHVRRKKIPNCENKPDWKLEKGCIEDEKYEIVRRHTNGFAAICPGQLPGGSGEMEERELDWKTSWPNPYFKKIEGSGETAFFDQMIVRTAKPFKIKPLKMALDFFQNKAYFHHFKTCRVFGYGLDNNGQSGILHGIRIPNIHHSNYYIEFRSRIQAVEPGDSGGTVVCKDKEGPNGEYHLVAVNANTTGFNPDQDQFDFKSRLGGFSNISSGAGKRWLEFVTKRIPIEARHRGQVTGKDMLNDAKKKKAGLPIDTDPDLDAYVTGFELFTEMPGELAELKSCVDIYSKLYPNASFKGYRDVYDQLTTVHQGIYQEYEDAKRGGSDGLQTIAVPVAKHGAYFGEPFFSPRFVIEKYNKKNYVLDYTRIAINKSYEILRPEIAYCYNQGMSFDGKGHDLLDRAKERFAAEVVAPEIEKWWPSP